MNKISRNRDRTETRADEAHERTGTLYLVKRLEQAIRQRLDEALRELDLTAQQYTTLTVLRARPGLSSAELARRSFVTPQSMNEMVLALERKGLMVRVPSETDGRVLVLQLTPSSKKVLAVADDVVAALERRLVAGIEGVPRDVFRSSLFAALRAITDAPSDVAKSAPRAAPVRTATRSRAKR